MIIVREVFTCKPGQASKFAKLMKKAFIGGNYKVMTDLVGNYNTVLRYPHSIFDFNHLAYFQSYAPRRFD